MKQKINEINVKTILTKTRIPGIEYCLNPYTGCSHACKYCYATFMKRFTGHIEPWGSFVDVKINAPEVLRKQLKRTQKGNIIISSVTDPYQPVEKKYMLTRKCLEVLAQYKYPVNILTKSPLVLRDLDIISKMNAEVGITISTDNDSVRKIFEPCAPSIISRVEALKQLHKSGIYTYAFIGPILPMNPDSLAKLIKPYVSGVIIDKMNYESKVKGLYREPGMEKWLDKSFIDKIIAKIENNFADKDVEIC